ncbi:MAG: class I SAM-dependent methyltransferase [Chloroflexota bacterium]|nr:class I SAM-dependent methyltransferase [Chloroflexota bacterium]
MAQVARPARIVGMDERNRSAFALLAAMQLDLFTPLADGPMRAEKLAGLLDVDAEKLSLLLYVLVVDGLLTVKDGQFANTEETDQFLVRGKPAYMGSVHTLWSELASAYLKTAESVRTGIPQARHNYGEMGEADLLVTLGGLHPGALSKGRALAARYDFSSCRSMLDVAGGTGGLSIGLVEACPTLHATIAELPGVIPLARRFVAEAGMQDRIDAVAVDLLHDAISGQFDVAVVNILIQVLSAEDAQTALRTIGRAVRSGGRIFVIGNVLDDSRLAPATAVRANIAFLNFYDGGQSYTEGEHRAWLTDAGFVDITREEEVNGIGLIRATRGEREGRQ